MLLVLVLRARTAAAYAATLLLFMLPLPLLCTPPANVCAGYASTDVELLLAADYAAFSRAVQGIRTAAAYAATVCAACVGAHVHSAAAVCAVLMYLLLLLVLLRLLFYAAFSAGCRCYSTTAAYAAAVSTVAHAYY